MSVVVLGSANLDLVYRVRAIPVPGETVLASGFEQNPGGKGNNQAIAVARAGAPVTFIAAVGTDQTGDALLAVLRAEQIGVSVRRVAEPTGTALVTVDDSAENTIVVVSGANASLTDLNPQEIATIAASDYLLLQLETPLATVISAAAIGAANGTTVVLNAAPIRDLPRGLLESIDVLVVNEHEASHLATALAPERRGTATLTVGTARDAARLLLQVVRAVIVTVGADGAIVLTREMGQAPAVHVPGLPVEAIDSTGAGDTFCGALVAALDASARGSGASELIRAAEFATIAAALSVQGVGAVPSIPTRKEIDNFRSRPR